MKPVGSINSITWPTLMSAKFRPSGLYTQRSVCYITWLGASPRLGDTPTLVSIYKSFGIGSMDGQ